MIKILSIGNSFSQDAQRYLHNLAKNEGVEMKCMNLYIGGCSLYTHYINMLEDKPSYEMEFNGQPTKIYVSIAQALASDEWDFVTLQQASGKSYDFDTYTPYISQLAECVRMYAPKAKLLIHQTWAYETGSGMLAATPYPNFEDMFKDVMSSYKLAVKEIDADGIIPSGEAVLRALELGVGKIHRDGFHMDLGIGRYMLALVWYMTLSGKKAVKEFTDLDVEADNNDLRLVKEAAEYAANKYIRA